MKAKTPRKSESRRLEARRQRSEQRGSLFKQLTDKVGLAALAIGVAFYVAILTIQFWGGESMPWHRGQGVDQDIIARVDFAFEDQVKTRQAQEAARNSAPNVYAFNEAPVALVRGELTKLGELVGSSGGDASELRKQASDEGWSLDESAAQVLLDYAEAEKHADYKNLVADLLDRLAGKYIVERPSDPNRKTIPATAMMRRAGRAPNEVPESELRYIADGQGVQEAVAQVVVDTRSCPPALRAPLSEKIAGLLLKPPGANAPLPLWNYSPQATAAAMEEAARGAEAHVVLLKKGTTLVKAGAELGVAELALLRHEHERYLVEERTDPELRQKKLLSELGVALVVLVVIVGLGAYTLSYQSRVFQNPARALGLAGLVLLVVLMSRLNEWTYYPWDSPLEFSVFFVVVAAALLTIAYDQRFAFGVGGALVALVTIASRGEWGLFLTLMTAMGVTVFALKEIRTRSKLVAVGAMAAVGAGITSLATGLGAGQGPRYVLVQAGVASGAALFAGFFVQGILHYYERLFGIATSMTLLEWSDASRPLLRRLAQEAPGTYSHSVVLSQMAEDACETIGARGLLARVGALYHDIGKTQKPAYFVENQEARMSRHAGLSPTMSRLIIVGHVKDGIETARAYGVPRILHQFIAEHHGTTIVKYFHHIASEAAAKNNKAKGRHDREVAESEFRYAGPKPQSKESAILMLCDSCEGAVRAQSEPTLGRIESTVHQVLMDRLNDGQFDACDITLRELKLVEQSLVKSLAAIHHGRIKYPKGAAERERPGAGEAGPADGEAPAEATPPTAEVAQRA